jgi:hypothetical protein
MSLDDNTRGRQAVILSSVFSAFAAFTVLLRLYTRIFIIRCPGVEDYFVSFALVWEPYLEGADLTPY